MDKNGKVSGTPVWLSIEEMELIVKRLPKASQGPQWKTIDELWVKIQLKLDDIKRFNEVEI